MNRRFALAVVLGSLVSSPVFAQPAPTPPSGQPTTPETPPADTFEAELDGMVIAGGLTAEQAATGAQKASPAVLRRSAEIEAAIAQLETVELARIPRVTGEASYTRLSPIDPIVLGQNPVTGEPFAIEFLNNQYITRASIGIPLSDYLLRFPRLIDAAKLGVEAAKLAERTGAVDAAYQAKLAYYEWIRTRLQVMVAKRQLVQVRATLGQVRALADAQRVSKADLLRVESQEAQADQVADQLEQLAALREEQLRLLVGAPANTPLTIGEDIRADLAPSANSSLDELVALANGQRLELKAIDTGIAAKEEQKRAEQANLYPKLSAFATLDYARPNQRVFPQVDEFRMTWTAGVQLSWTLNDALVAKQTKRRIDAEESALRADRENVERGLRVAVLAAQQAVLVAQHALQSSAKGLAAAEEAYRVRQALLAAQRATAVELVDAETELTRARIAALNARIDLRVALTQLAYATGQTSK